MSNISKEEQTRALLKEYERLIDTHVYHSRFALTVFPLILGLFGAMTFISPLNVLSPLAFLYLFSLLIGAMCLCHRIAIQTGLRLVESEEKLNYHLELFGDMRLSRFTREDPIRYFDWLYILPLLGVILVLLTLLWIVAVGAPEKGTFNVLTFFQELFQGKGKWSEALIAIPLFLSMLMGFSMVISEYRFQRCLKLEDDGGGPINDEGEDEPAEGVGEFILRSRIRKSRRR